MTKRKPDPLRDAFVQQLQKPEGMLAFIEGVTDMQGVEALAALAEAAARINATSKEAEDVARQLHDPDAARTPELLRHALIADAVKRKTAASGGAKGGHGRATKPRALEAWASGQYATKDDCARAVADELCLSFDAVRKHLRGA